MKEIKFDEAMKEINIAREDAIKKLHKLYADSNNPYKIGDKVTCSVGGHSIVIARMEIITHHLPAPKRQYPAYSYIGVPAGSERMWNDEMVILHENRVHQRNIEGCVK